MDNERPTPLVKDSEATRKKLESWFSERRGQAVRIPELKIPEASGMSNVTLLFDIEWQEDETLHRQACVGRLQPEISRPIFPSYDLTLQYEVMDSIGRNSDIPVPGLLGLETDASLLGVQFYIMKRIEGRIPGDLPPYNMDGWMVHETTEPQRQSLWKCAVDTLGQYHKLDYRKLGFEKLEAVGKTPLQQQLDYWQDYLEWAMEGRGHEICQTALNWLRKEQPQDEPTVLCWGDSRIGNVIFEKSLDKVAAVLDWEMAVLGNPVQDIAWLNYMDSVFAEGLGIPRLPGLPGYEDSVKQWRAVSGYSARDYTYYLIFAAMRFGLIMSRIMLATGQDGEVQENFACLLLKKHLDEKTSG